MSAVDGQPMPAADELAAVPMRRLAEAAGTVKSTLAESDFMTRMRSDIEQVREKEVRDALADHLDVIAAHFGDATLWFGAWHGDWVPWNMARHGDEVLLWDWEHYEEGVPVGFDALHFLRKAAAQCRSQAPRPRRGELVGRAPLVARAARRPGRGSRPDGRPLPAARQRALRHRGPVRPGRLRGTGRMGAATARPHGRRSGLDRRESGCLSLRVLHVSEVHWGGVVSLLREFTSAQVNRGVDVHVLAP